MILQLELGRDFYQDSKFLLLIRSREAASGSLPQGETEGVVGKAQKMNMSSGSISPVLSNS
jgi:hypothetical protein